jgi:hypothetical protein
MAEAKLTLEETESAPVEDSDTDRGYAGDPETESEALADSDTADPNITLGLTESDGLADSETALPNITTALKVSEPRAVSDTAGLRPRKAETESEAFAASVKPFQGTFPQPLLPHG